MIRGPILPQSRERLWPIVVTRLDAIESGLELVLQGFDCSGGQLGVIDGLCRDAAGAPVLVALAVEGDALLMPRLVAAAEFLDRVGGALADAVPEGRFCADARPRLVVIGSESSATALSAVARLGLSGLDACRLEPFRIAGSERFAVRWLADRAGGADDVAEDAASDAFAAAGPLWQEVVELCERLDPGVSIDGGRFRRRISWRGRVLAHVVSSDSTLRAAVAGGRELLLSGKGDVRAFADQLMRRYADLAGLRGVARHAVDQVPSRSAEPAQPMRAPSRDVQQAASRPTETLRSALAEALLSPEEFAALTGPPDPGPPADSPH